MLCSRLSEVLPCLISHNQGAFIKGRSLAHNILIFQDLIKNYNRKNTSLRCVLKTDLSKAYDTVDWGFLERLLISFRFPTRFINWVMVCLRGTSYVLMMNGRLQGGFQGVKGLRQGDPISPLLFVLVMEYLSRLLQLGAKQPAFRSGMKANLSKSQVFFGGISAQDKAQLQKVLQLEEGSFPLKYLGIPMRPTKWKEADCGEILKKIKLRLHTWSSRHLSYAGLGFGEGTKWNKAMLGKYLWAISHQQEALWVKWIHSVYLKGQDFWLYQLKADTSWYWKKVFQLRSLFTQEDIDKASSQGKFKIGLLYASLIHQAPVKYHQFLWSRMSVPKHKFITWQAINSKLLTRDHLLRVFLILESTLCPVCELIDESHSHLFFDCIFSQQVVRLVQDWVRCNWPLFFSAWTGWIEDMRRGVRASLVAAVFSATVYYLWHNRNICFIHHYSLSVKAVIDMIKKDIMYRLSCFSHKNLRGFELSF
ncbi:uncharacterized protein LOC133785613 [Humulus lupulus]|uniref:uncharacterized protein LOC133785613 n=1 Tax=Humulus lupulus TaxID=3486 RepID=UPI002B40EFF3|nr:uncharacterized protein LOC133785613 [Humulus lupulus]